MTNLWSSSVVNIVNIAVFIYDATGRRSLVAGRCAIIFAKLKSFINRNNNKFKCISQRRRCRPVWLCRTTVLPSGVAAVPDEAGPFHRFIKGLSLLSV